MQLPDSPVRLAGEEMDLSGLISSMQLRESMLRTERQKLRELMRLRMDKLIPGTLTKADEVPPLWDGTEPPFAFGV